MREHITWWQRRQNFSFSQSFFLRHNCVSSASVHVGAVCSVLLELRCVHCTVFAIGIFCKNIWCTLFCAVGLSDFWESTSKKILNTISSKHGWLRHDNKQQVQRRHKWLLTRAGKLATCLSLTDMMDSGFAGCFQLSSGSLLWNLPDLRPSGFPPVHRWQETRTRHKRKCHDNGRTRKRPFSRRLVWLPWLEYFPTEQMEERTSLEAERSIPLSQTVSVQIGSTKLSKRCSVNFSK